MAGFKPRGVSLPQQFSKSQQSKQMKRDRLVEVVSYNLSNASIRARDVRTGKLMDVTIDPDTINRQNENAAKRAIERAAEPARDARQKEWVGWQINANMAADIKPGTLIVLERTLAGRRSGARGGDDVMNITAGYIHNAGNGKALAQPFSITTYEGRVQNVLVWEPKGINPMTDEGSAEIDSLGAKLDEAHNGFLVNQKNRDDPNAKYQPYTSYGVKLRCLVAGEPDKDGNPTYLTVDTSTAFDWMTADEEAGRTAAPLTAEQLNVNIQDYIDYIYGNESASLPPAFGANYSPEQLTVEVMVYRKYLVSSKAKDFTVEGNYAFKALTSTPSRLSLADPSPDAIENGRNFAVDGIVLLTGDKADNATRTFTPRDLVTKLFTNSYRASVQNFVKTSDDKAVKLHPDLIIAQAPAANAGTPGGDASTQRASTPSVGSAGLPDASQNNAADPFAENDPFAESASASTPAPVAAPVAPAPAAAPTPAPAPAAAPTPAPAPAPTSTGSRFSHSRR